MRHTQLGNFYYNIVKPNKEKTGHGILAIIMIMIALLFGARLLAIVSPVEGRLSEVIVEKASDTHWQFTDTIPIIGAGMMDLLLNDEIAPEDLDYVYDSAGVLHYAYAQNDDIFYISCDSRECSEPVSLNEKASCGSGTPSHPAIAANNSEVFVTWEHATGLAYATFSATDVQEDDLTGCLKAAEFDSVGLFNPEAVGQGENFVLALNTHESDGPRVFKVDITQNSNESTLIDEGQFPEVLVKDNQVNVVYCGNDAGLYEFSTAPELISELTCLQKPGVYSDQNGDHILWSSNILQNQYGVPSTANIVYEISYRDGAWNTPIIVSRSEKPVFPLILDSQSTRDVYAHLSNEEDFGLMRKPHYSCNKTDLSEYMTIIDNIASQDKI